MRENLDAMAMRLGEIQARDLHVKVEAPRERVSGHRRAG
jgi:hypothetical protein